MEPQARCGSEIFISAEIVSGLKHRRFSFYLKGKKLRGEFSLVLIKGRGRGRIGC